MKVYLVHMFSKEGKFCVTVGAYPTHEKALEKAEKWNEQEKDGFFYEVEETLYWED